MTSVPLALVSVADSSIGNCLSRRHALGFMAVALPCLTAVPSRAEETISRRFTGNASQIVWESLEYLPTVNIGHGQPIYMLVAPYCPFSQRLYRQCRIPHPRYQARLIASPSDDCDYARYGALLQNPTLKGLDDFMANHRRASGVSWDAAWEALPKQVRKSIANVAAILDGLGTAQENVGLKRRTPSLYWQVPAGVVTINGYSPGLIDSIVNPN